MFDVSPIISGYHQVERIKLGLPVNHDNQSMEAVMWKYTYIRLSKLSVREFKQSCDAYSKQLRGKVNNHISFISRIMN